VALIGVAAISLFFWLGGSFGPLNDVCNAAQAVLSGALAWRLYPWHQTHSARNARLGLMAAGLGAALAVTGSVLVLTRRTGWYLAGLYTMAGYAFIGLWGWAVNTAAVRQPGWPRGLARLGQVAGALSAIGLLSAAGIPGRVDSVSAAPWWVNVGLAGGAGWMALYPLWCLWLGRWLATRRDATRPRSSVSAIGK
jgi:hypothetical protein